MSERKLWKAFGCVDQGIRLEDAINVIPEHGDMPDAEITGGIANISVTTHGDAPMSCFLSVIATSKSQAVNVWTHVANDLSATSAGWWTATSGVRGATR